MTSLSLNDNSLTEIDLSKNVNLTSLNLNDNSLIDIDLSKNVNLTSLGLNGNSLKNVDLSKNVALTFLGLSGNSLKNVDLSKNVNLTSLNLSHNSLTEIDLSSNTELTRLDLSYNGLRSVDLSGLTSNLTYFTFSNQERNIKHVKDGEEVEGELGELVPQYGYVNKYTVPVTITGYETNQDYTLDYNVSWINVILGNGMPIYSASISEFLSQRSCLNSNKCEFYVNDGENDLTEGLFEDKAYTLKVYDDGDFLKEYSLVFGVREINLDVQNLRLGLEDEYYLSPIFTPEYAYNQDVTWSSSDESVATVDENGMVTAVGVGEAVIIVRADDSSKIARCNVTVVEVLEHKVTYILGDGESIEKNFVPETDIIAGFNEPDLLYKFGFKLIGWTYNYRDYNLDDELLMPSYDIEVTAIWETISDTSSKYQIETFDDGKVVKDVHPNTKIVSYFDLGLGEEYIVRVFTSNGILQKVSGTIGTGNLARVYVDGKLVDEYVISVKGDLNGGGTVNATDMISLRRYIKMALNEENVDSCYRLAGDFTGNGKINANDMIGLRSYIKEVLSSDD